MKTKFMLKLGPLILIVNLFFSISAIAENIYEEKTKDIIKPYYTTKEKGTGLGLSIVDKIINDHNGSIKFLNTINGAKVQIILPK